MKKIMNTSLIYCVLAMAGGVFYREFTKWNGYTAVSYTHLMEQEVYLIYRQLCYHRKRPKN